jgi:protease I
MARVLMIVAQDGFRDEELLVPKEVLEREGHSVKVASKTRMKARGSRGASVMPDMAFYEINPDFFDCLIVVGGPGSPALADEPEVRRLLMGAMSKGKVIGGICLGPLSLAASNVLLGRRATIYPDKGAIRRLRECAAEYVREPVVVDGKVVTADGPASAGAFGSAIAGLLK